MEKKEIDNFYFNLIRKMNDAFSAQIQFEFELEFEFKFENEFEINFEFRFEFKNPWVQYVYRYLYRKYNSFFDLKTKEISKIFHFSCFNFITKIEK